MEMKIGSLIAENDNYTLNVCELPDATIPVYGIVNKKYGVVEMSTSVLANAKKFLQMLNKWELEPPEEEDNAMPDFSPDGSSYSSN